MAVIGLVKRRFRTMSSKKKGEGGDPFVYRLQPLEPNLVISTCKVHECFRDP